MAVVEATVGPVKQRDAIGQETQTDQNYLSLKVKICCTDADKKIDYRSWRSQLLRAGSAQVTDDAGNSYKAVNFGFDKVNGAQKDRAVYADRPILDVLVFERPVNSKRTLFVKLDGGNIGQQSPLEFAIAPDGISWPSKKAEKNIDPDFDASEDPEALLKKARESDKRQREERNKPNLPKKN